MKNSYDHSGVESKWQQRWEEEQLYAADEDSEKEKRYVLDMYPYPSGAGLHVGHVEGYTATDIYTRYLRMRGYNVLHPIGWDAFGLPAENYAVKTGIHPKETTDSSIKNFIEQIKRLGLSYDWSREIGTHTPEYYKWTQWFFLLLYKNNLAYKKDAPVNWDPIDQTVLANEQVLADGTAERSGAVVEKRNMMQWFFKITDYAEALDADLDLVDWPESTITNQRNWIGKSEGAELQFPIVGKETEVITVFTTRPDTLYGATYMVMAPEHPLLDLLKGDITNWNEVAAYVKESASKSDIERSAEGKEKSGVRLEGVMAINPATKEEIPIFIADYVLGHYGTGAIMAVPAHDERDWEFAKKYNCAIREVIERTDAPAPFTGNGILKNSGTCSGMESLQAKSAITEMVGGHMKTTYRLRDWLIGRQRYWGAPIPIVYDPEGNPHPIPEEHLPWLLPTDVDFEPKGYSPLSRSKELHARTEKIFGTGWTPEVDTMDTFVCSSWYFFRFADPHNEQAFASAEQIKKWLPVDLYVGGAEHTVLHLLYARFFTKVLHTLGYISFSEPFLKLRHPGTILAEDGRKMSKSLNNVVNPNDVVDQYGADAVRMYEMFMGPLADMKPWSTQNISGVRRFLEKVWRLQASVGDEANATADSVLHYTVKKVGDDIESQKFNTAISQLMICLNALQSAPLSRAQWSTFIRILAPFAPHMTEELWEKIGEEGSIHSAPWPQYDADAFAQESAPYAVQVNGKVRGTITLKSGVSEQEAIEQAKAVSNVAAYLNGKEIKRTVFVAGRLINFVV
ncbi:leucine--tRNA ligase [Candidatus Kaiserbacteria bacterium CG10_big_fil_rev_8_21_14_0_10_49_17]|uniref:Leucine--tRNA ligase n=1 Tax=Candidatus Kaiserbacteria bacterium CG10_big_fil_rev_8_21_14_0_10_49_17 TaxID=1974609 RepID=A0A2M6WF38_9BACT|nr:MAG: leucine--tRNA ligase [Candidatus Kaiserbacteria bacterium CG10_big_fil_rev_8_21_14_0_10_49_17]